MNLGHLQDLAGIWDGRRAGQVVADLERTFGADNYGTMVFDNLNTAWCVRGRRCGRFHLVLTSLFGAGGRLDSSHVWVLD